MASKILENDLLNKGVLGMADKPGLSAKDMQYKFEEIQREIIIPKLNEVIGEVGSMLSPFDNEKTYAVGEYCIYKDELYKCIDAVTIPGTWNDKKWGVTTLSDALKDLQSQVDNAIKESANAVAEEAAARKAEIAIERARIDSIAKLPEGSTTGDAELIDGRVDYKGNTHTNIGEHIREVSSQLSSEIVDVESQLSEIETFNETLGYSHDVVISRDFINGTWANGSYRTDGNYGTYYRSARELIDLRDFTLKVKADNVDNLIYSWCAFSETDAFIGGQAGAFGYMQNGIANILESVVKAQYPGAKKVSISVGSYNGSAFVPFSDNMSIVAFYKSDSAEKIIDRVSRTEYELAQNIDRVSRTEYELAQNRFTNYLFPKCGKNKINVIGDSISQGVYSDDASKDSYVGILRNLISKDLSGKLNYGFAPFNIQNGYSQAPKHWWNKNVITLNSRGNATEVIDGRCFGVLSYNIIDKTPFRFTINDYNVKKIKISYLGGINGVLTVSKGSDNVLGTIDCNSDAVEAKMSQIFDLGAIDESTRIIITLTGGTEAYVSGIELIYDENYKTFNNYSLAGTSTKQQVDDTISKECDCDFLIWAIGFNDRTDVDSFRINIARYIPIIKAKNCECVVMDFQWDKSNGCKNVLRDMAIALNCKYIDMTELAPRKLNGELIDGFLNEDGVHPEALGHQFIAECIAKKINLDNTTKAIANA